MAWHLHETHEPTDVDDEASVGLMSDKVESATGRIIEQRPSWISMSSLGVGLVLTNIAWAGICLSLLRGLHLPYTTVMSQQGFGADFGTSTSMN